jgi:putative polyhydroxyalkanoic acid system protein
MQKKTIDVSIPHRLGKDEAKLRLQGGAERLRSQFGGQVAQVHETWTGHHADFAFSAMGQSITGRMDVEDAAIKLSVDVPWMLAMIADKIRGKIEQEGRKLLEKKK